MIAESLPGGCLPDTGCHLHGARSTGPARGIVVGSSRQPCCRDIPHCGLPLPLPRDLLGIKAHLLRIQLLTREAYLLHRSLLPSEAETAIRAGIWCSIPQTG